MGTFKGTKGKWVHSRINAVYALNDECIAITYTNNKEANARLISKAPEMLEMLEKVCHFIDKNKDQNYMVGLLSRGVPEIKQLIKESTEL
jgi:hypothetical protein